MAALIESDNATFHEVLDEVLPVLRRAYAVYHLEKHRRQEAEPLAETVLAE